MNKTGTIREAMAALIAVLLLCAGCRRQKVLDEMSVHFNGVENGVCSFTVRNESKESTLLIPPMFSSKTHEHFCINGIVIPYCNILILDSGKWVLFDDFHPAHPRGYTYDEFPCEDMIEIKPEGRYDFHFPLLQITNKWKIGIGGFRSGNWHDVGADSEGIESSQFRDAEEKDGPK